MNDVIITLEKERKHALIPFWMFLGMLAFSLMLMSVIPAVGLALIIISIILYAFLYSRFHKRYAARYKELAVRAALEKEYDDLVYEPKKGFDEEYIRSLNCIELGSEYHSEDWFSGKYEGVPLESADMYIADTSTDSDGNSNTTVYFHGRWTVFDFNKSFRYNLLVRQKGFYYAKTSSGWFSHDLPLKKIRMESEAFNYAFTVYGADEHEAFYILTPSVMDAMLKVREHVKGKLMFCFIDNKLHVAFYDNHDDFEPPVFRRITEEGILRDVVGEAGEAAAFAEALRLEKKIWTSGGYIN